MESLRAAEGGKSSSMKSYVRGVLGGILALLAAFGWTVTAAFAIAMKYSGGNDKAYGLDVVRANGPVLWVFLLLIFTVGFYFGFRKVY
jgi:hypothetical protein